MPESAPTGNAALSDGFIAVTLPQGWLTSRVEAWDHDICRDGYVQQASPAETDELDLSATLGQAVGATPLGVEAVLLQYFNGALPQPPSEPRVERDASPVRGAHATRVHAVYEPDPEWHWDAPGYALDFITVQANPDTDPPLERSDTRWLATIHRACDAAGTGAIHAIWESLVITRAPATPHVELLEDR